MPSFTANAVVAARSFMAGAWIIGSRWRHHRTHDHIGPEYSSTVALDERVGGWEWGTPLTLVLQDLYDRILALEDSYHLVGQFLADASILGPGQSAQVAIPGTPFGFFWADSVILGSASGSFTAEWWLVGGSVITADAWLAGRFTADAVIA